MISINYKDCSLMDLHQIDVAVHLMVHLFSPIFITWFYYFFTLCILIIYIITIVRQSNFSQSYPDF